MAIHLLTGDDTSIVRSSAHDLVRGLVGDDDWSLMVEEFEGDDYTPAAVVDAAATPPLLTNRRVVVARDVGRFGVDELAPLLELLASPPVDTDVVLVAGGGRLAKKLQDAVVAAGGTVTDTKPPRSARDRSTWVAERALGAGVRLDGAAAARVAAWLGDDIGRLDGIVATLVSTFGTDVPVGRDDVEPFLGDAGGVPPWEFTDAVDAGDARSALTMLHRMLHAGERHPLQIMAILHGHYARLARLDGASAGDADSAAHAMGIKPGFQAKKALATFRRLGGDGVARAIELLATADLDLRGGRDLPDDVVMEVLVARLARLAGARR